MSVGNKYVETHSCFGDLTAFNLCRVGTSMSFRDLQLKRRVLLYSLNESNKTKQTKSSSETSLSSSSNSIPQRGKVISYHIKLSLRHTVSSIPPYIYIYTSYIDIYTYIYRYIHMNPYVCVRMQDTALPVVGLNAGGFRKHLILGGKSFSLSVSGSVCLSLSVSVSLSLCLCLCVSLSISPFRVPYACRKKSASLS